MKKQNCWEFYKCGRELGGFNATHLGTCPASFEIRTNKFNGAENGGRNCWAIAGTFCKEKTSGIFARESGSCLKCEFYKKVMFEEGANLYPTKFILKTCSV
jgi:hypothetical protein